MPSFGLRTLVWPVQDFLALGGPVLFAVMLVTFVMWFLIAERYWYFATWSPRALRRYAAMWKKHDDAPAWRRRAVRRRWLSEYRVENERRLALIRALVRLSLLLGLLGTVVGMIEVFDALASTGSSDARTIASGVSRATIPTMAGMVAALSGFYFSAHLRHREKRMLGQLEEHFHRGAAG